MAESAYTGSLWTKTAIDAIKGNVEDKKAFLKAMRTVKVKAPRGPLHLDDYDHPVQNVYIAKVVKVNHPILGEVRMTVPIKTYKEVSQFWTWKPSEFLARGPYKR
jgi:branched-chain amino acid transport system substrate-binding protein